MTLTSPASLSHASVLRIAVPIILSNVTEPLIGVVNTAVMGRLPEPHYIGGVAVGALIFSFLFWGFGFLRLSTGGMAAQATGANDKAALATLLVRSLGLAALIGLALVLAGPWLGPLAVKLMGGSDAVQDQAQVYFSWRIWSAPAALINFVILGWFIGQGRASMAFVLQLFLNLTNMALSMVLVLKAGMATAGVGLAAVSAQYAAAIVGLACAHHSFRKLQVALAWPDVFARDKVVALIAVNRDIMIRTFLLVFAFGWFVSRGARQGDLVVAANAVVLNLFEVSAYLMDGFAYAAEALVGQAIGARDRLRFRRAIWLTTIWAGVLSVLCATAILTRGESLVDLMTISADVRATAYQFLPWAALATLGGMLCFQLDGIFTGALATRDMRNMMLLSTLIYMACWWWLEPLYGNHGLWAALNIFFVARGLTFASRMGAIERRSFYSA